MVLSLRGRNIRGAEAQAARCRVTSPIKRMLWISPNHLDAAYMAGHVEAAVATA